MGLGQPTVDPPLAPGAPPRYKQTAEETRHRSHWDWFRWLGNQNVATGHALFDRFDFSSLHVVMEDLGDFGAKEEHIGKQIGDEENHEER